MPRALKRAAQLSFRGSLPGGARFCDAARMGSVRTRGRAAGTGVNSARGWSRLGRAYAATAFGVAVYAGSLALLLGVGSLTSSDWLSGWGLLVLGLTVVPLVAVVLMSVLAVRLRIAPVGLVVGVLLVVWLRATAPSADDPTVVLPLGLAVAPALAAVLTHPWRRRPRPGDQGRPCP